MCNLINVVNSTVLANIASVKGGLQGISLVLIIYFYVMPGTANMVPSNTPKF